jgi:phosphoglycolate phosphatase
LILRYQGVFFDFDYTLGDSTIPITMGYQQGFQAMGWPAPTQEQVRPTVGMTLMDGYTMLTCDRDESRRQEFYHRFQEAVGELATGEGATVMVERTRLLPGGPELLTGLRAQGVKVAIVSTKLGVTIRRIFAHQGLEQVLDLVVGGEDVSRAKPDPEGLNFALDRLGLDRSQVLFCGDTVIDAATARNGGVDFCAVLNGTTQAPAFADYPHVHIAPDLPDLKNWLWL